MAVLDRVPSPPAKDPFQHLSRSPAQFARTPTWLDPHAVADARRFLERRTRIGLVLVALVGATAVAAVARDLSDDLRVERCRAELHWRLASAPPGDRVFVELSSPRLPPGFGATLIDDGEATALREGDRVILLADRCRGGGR